MRIALLAVFLTASPASPAVSQPPPCADCAEWNRPQAPLRLFGNTYYVGPHGLSAILVTSPAGHVLIDTGLPESAAGVAASIRTLGFKVEDVRLILNSHVHFDHAGGIAALQKISGAEVAASPANVAALTRGIVLPSDPQFGAIPPVEPVGHVRTIRDGEVIRVGELAMTAHLTPGHTPGGTTWTWRSCEGSRCVDMVYADSLTAVSAPGFLFTRNKDYPDAVADFEKSFRVLSSLPCDILVTPHPESSGLWVRLARGRKGAGDHPLIDSTACTRYVDAARERLKRRIETEKSPAS